MCFQHRLMVERLRHSHAAAWSSRADVQLPKGMPAGRSPRPGPVKKDSTDCHCQGLSLVSLPLHASLIWLCLHSSATRGARISTTLSGGILPESQVPRSGDRVSAKPVSLLAFLL